MVWPDAGVVGEVPDGLGEFAVGLALVGVVEVLWPELPEPWQAASSAAASSDTAIRNFVDMMLFPMR
jgi:hypothetical protein